MPLGKCWLKHLISDMDKGKTGEWMPKPRGNGQDRRAGHMQWDYSVGFHLLAHSQLQEMGLENKMALW
jgi:hypothetical protein